MSSPHAAARRRTPTLAALLAVLLMLPAGLVLSGPAQAAAAFPVSGTVVDGLGDPVDGVTVHLEGTGATTGEGTGTSGTVGEEEGVYSVEVAPGTYTLTFSGPGFVSTPYAVDGTAAVVTVGTDGTLAVAPEEDLEDNGLSATTLVSDPVTVGGSVTDASAAPVQGVTVRAFAEGSTDLEDLVATASTGVDGSYSLALPVGSYEVQVVDLDGVAPTYAATWVAGAAHGALRVGRGGALSIDDVPVTGLPPLSLPLADSTTTHPVSGTVEDVNADPAAGLTVTATPTGATGSTAVATSDAEGDFVLDLVPGVYRVEVAGGSDFADTVYVGDGESAAAVSVELNGTVRVDGTETAGGDLGPTVLTGTRTFALHGGVSGLGGAGLGAMSVRVHPEEEPETTLATATTTGAGRFTVPGLRIGTYWLSIVDTNGADATTYVTAWYDGTATRAVKIDRTGTASVDDTVLPGNDLGTVAMTAATGDTTYPLSGSVSDANGEPLAATTVTATPAGAGTTASASTDAEGEYVLPVAAGSYRITFARTGHRTASYLDLEADPPAAAVVRVLTGGEIRIGTEPVPGGQLDPVVLYGTATHALTGKVVDAGGAALAGITVTAVPDDYDQATVAAVSTGTGAYRLNLPVGTYRIGFADNLADGRTYVATSYGGASPTPVRVATGGTFWADDVQVAALADVTMRLASADATYDLVGTASDWEYEPLDDVRVTVLPAGTHDEARRVATGTTGADPDGLLGDAGVYRIPVKPGRYWLRLSRAGYATAYLTNLDAPGPVTVTVALDGRVSAPGLDLVDGVLDDVTLQLPAPVLVTAPRLTGKAVVGQSVTATLGTWRPAAIDTDYVTVEWFLDGRAADDWSAGAYFQKFKVTTAAAGRKLSFRITVEDEDGMRAPAVFTSAATAVPLAKPKLTAKYAKGRLNVTVKVPTLARPSGTVTVLKGKKKVATARLKAKGKGKVVVPLAKLAKGKHKLTVVYSGARGVAGSKAKVTVRR